MTQNGPRSVRTPLVGADYRVKRTQLTGRSAPGGSVIFWTPAYMGLLLRFRRGRFPHLSRQPLTFDSRGSSACK